MKRIVALFCLPQTAWWIPMAQVEEEAEGVRTACPQPFGTCEVVVLLHRPSRTKDSMPANRHLYSQCLSSFFFQAFSTPIRSLPTTISPSVRKHSNWSGSESVPSGNTARSKMLFSLNLT